MSISSHKLEIEQVKDLQTDLDSKQSTGSYVTTDTTQVVKGQKRFEQTLQRTSTKVDITVKPETYVGSNGIQFLDKNFKTTGFVEHALTPKLDGEVRTSVDARNKDDFQASVGIAVPYEGTAGAYGYAPTYGDNAPNEAIVTKNKIANMVTTNTNQTISGTKTLTTHLFQTLDKNQGETSAYNEKMLYVQSKDGKRIGSFGAGIQIAGQSRAYIASSFTKEDGSIIYSIIDTYTDGTNTRATAPTPTSTAENSNKIATTAWFNNKIKVVSALPASTDPNVFYFIPE